jgi:hypothetical protein
MTPVRSKARGKHSKRFLQPMFTGMLRLLRVAESTR